MTTYAEYQQLINKALTAAKAYYHTGEELMTDEEYDALVEHIEYLSDEYGWTDGDVLKEVAAGTTPDKVDVVHEIPMLSLAKANTIVTVEKFINQTRAELTLEPKFDGLAISAIYKNGQLIQVATRGGENITNKAQNIKGLPNHINTLYSHLEVRGEVFMTRNDFEQANLNRLRYAYHEWAKKWEAKTPTLDSLYRVALKNRYLEPDQQKTVLGQRTSGATSRFNPADHIFANERNAIAGSLRKDNHDYQITMTFACYDVLGDDTKLPDTYRERLTLIENYGITTATGFVPEEVKQLTNIMNQLEQFGEIRANGQLAYPTDGAVLKVNNINERNKLGLGNSSPKWAIAYKYPSVQEQTKVLSIETSIGRTGRLALRANVEPVLVDGTLISKVSLHNVDWLQKKDIRIGDTVLIRRANDVIPQIDAYIPELRPATAQPWQPPQNCPQCGHPFNKDTLLWRCTSPSCGVINGLIFAAGRDYFDWEGMSEKVITRLNENGLVNTIADVFKLSIDDLAELPMGRNNKNGEPILLGDKTAQKIYTKIQESKNKPFHVVLASLGIRSLGRTFSRQLANEYKNINNLYAATREDLTKVDGISDKKAEVIYNGLREKRELLKELHSLGLNLRIQQTTTTASPLAGKHICVSGSVPGYTRTGIQDKIASLGGIPSSSVSNSTDFLVAGPEMADNSKYKKALQLGKKIITPEEFLKLLNQ